MIFNDIVTAATAALILVVALGVPLYLRRRTFNLRMHEQLALSFFDKAETLAADASTPPQIRETLCFMAGEIADPKAARYLLAAIFRRDEKLAKGRAATAKDDQDEIDQKDVDAFFKARPELHKLYHGAVAAVIGAVLYRGSGFFGIVGRLWITRLTNKLDYDRTAAAFGRELRQEAMAHAA